MEDEIYDLTITDYSETEKSQFVHFGYIETKEFDFPKKVGLFAQKLTALTSTKKMFVEEFGWALQTELADVSIEHSETYSYYSVWSQKYGCITCDMFLDSALLQVDMVFVDELIRRFSVLGMEAYMNGGFLFVKRLNYNNYNFKKYENE